MAPHVPPLCRALRIPRRLDVDGVVLTFDDGPHPEGTPAVLDALGQNSAVFFMIGEQVERYGSLAAEVAAAGHEIALHGFRHRNQMRVTPRWLADDLARGADAIASATGRAPRLYRPPYGIF
ncbi:MAG: peptidoglycan-N-acetylglucosamine deacetylase, partial [Thermoleophilaceae bacterium]|nr:peptidoglycan-N-acetylglucosamine deacetylase [Thermoleophilaceae bacterium]